MPSKNADQRKEIARMGAIAQHQKYGCLIPYVSRQKGGMVAGKLIGIHGGQNISQHHDIVKIREEIRKNINHTKPNRVRNRLEYNEYCKNYMREYTTKLKEKAIEKLGGKCIYCGCDDKQALEFNHINGGGSKEFKTSHNKNKMLRMIITGERNDIELACKVCNALHYLIKIKGLVNNWEVKYQHKRTGSIARQCTVPLTQVS
jgi:hypothetical protein